jgi:tetratricopeptide (TPR) repeat protein
MRVAAVVLSVLLASSLATAQRHKPAAFDRATPEGQLLDAIGTEQDNTKKLDLLVEFAGKYPQNPSIPWVYDMMVSGYAKAGQPDKVIETGEKLLAMDPGDLATAHECLKAAEAKKDPDLVLKWSARASEMGRKVAQSPKPSDEAGVEEWKRSVDFAKQLDVYTEYSLYATMLQTTDLKKRIQLGEALEQRNPDSQYLPQVADQLVQSYVQAGEPAKGLAIAEKFAERDGASVEVLLAAASACIGKKPDKVIEYSNKALAGIEAKPKPDGVADADWQTWKTQTSGRAHWMAGLTYAGQEKWQPADQELRLALEGVKNDRDMMAEALFYLGLANYRIAEGGRPERARDALRFSQQCAEIPGRFQAQARINVKAIRSAYRIQ